jgi:signal transduction histidine kinase
VIPRFATLVARIVVIGSIVALAVAVPVSIEDGNAAPGVITVVGDPSTSHTQELVGELQARVTQEGDDLVQAPSALTGLIYIVVTLMWVITGALIVSRQPRNWAGWLFLLVGAALPAALLASQLTIYGVKANPGSVPLLSVWAIVGNFGLVPAVGLPLLMLLYPNGHPPSARWRWAVIALLAGAGIALAAQIVKPGPFNDYVDSGVLFVNPIGIERLDPLLGGVTFVGTVAAIFGGLGCAVGVVVRYRRSAGDERRQMQTLALVAGLAAGLLVLTIVGGSILEPEDQTGQLSIFDALLAISALILVVGIPVAYLIAIFRHGLWDLEVVIKKASVALLIAAIGVLISIAVLALPLQVALWQGTPRAVSLALGALFGVALLPIVRLARRLASRMVYGRRASSYEVLSTFSGRIGETYSDEDVLPRMARTLVEGTGAVSVRIFLMIGADLREVARAGDAAAGEEHVVPVVQHGERLGALAITMPANDPLDAARDRLVHDLASQAGPVLRNVRLIEELRASRQRLVAAQDEERRRLERNLHDGAQQQLVALTVQLKLARTMLDREPTKAAALLDGLQGSAGAALDDLRDLARGIYPPLLADQGLAAALEAQARRAVVPASVSTDGVGRYPQEIEAAVYFCSLEALNNIAKYANATSATVRLEHTDGRLAFTVTDDGSGFDPAETSYGTGLQGMADRLDAIGGSLTVASAPGSGTTVRGAVPVGVDG